MPCWPHLRQADVITSSTDEVAHKSHSTVDVQYPDSWNTAAMAMRG